MKIHRRRRGKTRSQKGVGKYLSEAEVNEWFETLERIAAKRHRSVMIEVEVTPPKAAGGST